MSRVVECGVHANTRVHRSVARGKRRGFSPGAAARPLDRTRVREDSGRRGESPLTRLSYSEHASPGNCVTKTSVVENFGKIWGKKWMTHKQKKTNVLLWK